MNGLTIDDGGDDKWRAGVQDDEDDVGEPGPLAWAQPRRKAAATVWHCCSGSSATGSGLGESGGADQGWHRATGHRQPAAGMPMVVVSWPKGVGRRRQSDRTPGHGAPGGGVRDARCACARVGVWACCSGWVAV